MVTLNIYGTLTNIANEVMRQREKYLKLEELEQGSVNVGDEIITIPQTKVDVVKIDLDKVRTRVAAMADTLKVEKVYR